MTIPKIEFYKLRDFGSKMNATVEFLRENMGRLFLNLLLIGGPLALVLSLLFNNLFSAMGDAANLGSDAEALGFFALLGGNYFLMMLISWLAVSMIISVTFSYMKLYNEGVAKETPVGDVFRTSMSKYGGILLLGFLITLVTIFGMFFFFIPGIFLGVTLSLAYPIYVFEDISPLNAFSRAFILIKGKWWSTFGLLFVTIVMAYVVQMVFSLPFMVVYLAKIFTLVEDMEQNTNDPTAIFEIFTSGYMTVAMAISMVGSYLTYSIPLIGIGYQYSNLVERSEGRGLMNEIEGFDKEA
ncbi:hypothetical protein [Ekhidna sp.]|uniref:hypothetical protein n=1 Tax=Ekhidna sp. TaxID=2608089 RepID=UPI003B5089D1